MAAFSRGKATNTRGSSVSDSVRRHAPATERNRDAILEVLREELAKPARVLEIASGTGEHAAYLAARLPHLHWQPSDLDPESLPSIDAWARESGCDTLAKAIALDVRDEPWPLEDVDAIFCANMIHISPFEACLGLLDGAARHLSANGRLVLYGPYKIGGEHTAQSNADFDASLRGRDPTWGVRDLETVCKEASTRGLLFQKRVPMPANNQIVIFEKPSA